MKNIILIGMPGCGKSTLGVVLAKILNMGFCDTDLLIQQNYGLTLQQIIDKDGIDSFMSSEEKVLCSLECENIVIATGGSAVLSEKSMQHLKSIGKVIYLKVPLFVLKKRVKNQVSRGIVFKAGESYGDIYRSRCPLYEKYADVTIDCMGSRERTLNALCKALK